MDLKALQDKIVELGTQMTAILDGVGADGRMAMNSDEESRFDKIDADRKTLLATEERARRLEESEKHLATSERRTQPTQPSQETRTSRTTRRGVSSSEQLEIMRAWLLAGSNVNITAEQRGLAAKHQVNLDGKQLRMLLPHEPYPSNLRPSREDIRDWRDRCEERALSTLNAGSPVDGYYTIADEMMRPLEEALLAFGGMRRRSTVFRTDTGAALPIPTNDDTGNEGEIIAENTSVNQKDVSFNQVVLDSYLYSSKMILVSIQLLQDSTVNLASFLGRKLGERIGRITNRHFTVGTGSGQPNGLFNATTASGVQLAAATPTYAELVSIQHSVDPAYRESGSVAWMFHDTMLAEIKKMVDASTGRPIWLPSMVGGQPDTILGDPYVINQHVAVAAGSGAGKSIAYGDLSKYQIRDVRDVTLLRLDERFAEYHQVAFLAFSRHDGDLLDAGTHPVKHALNKS